MSILRSKNLWLAAYFLSRCGNRTGPDTMPEPPAQLQVNSWNEAYDSFFVILGEGRTESAFRRTLKNARDSFDGHIDSGRIGWRDSDQGRPPQPLGEAAAGILAEWNHRSDDDLWEAVRVFVKHSELTKESFGNKNSRRRREHLLDAIRRENILDAFRLYDSGHSHGFADSTKFDLLHNGRAYPPKAIVGLAGVPLFGEPLKPEDFTGGAGSKCFKILTSHGFQVVPKATEFPPTADENALNRMTMEALSAPCLPKPNGQREPAKFNRTSMAFERDPLVRAFVLRRASGKCECCGKDAPFVDHDGVPFLEVHHINPLANGGEDMVENTAAICPNCHRECHHGRNAATLRQALILKVSALLNSEAARTL